jgi:hypothetical protein
MPEKDEEEHEHKTPEADESDNDSDEEAEEDQDTEETKKASVEYDAGLGNTEKVMPDGGEQPEQGKIKRFFAGYWHKKKWTLPLTLLAVIAIVFALPATRYPLLALDLSRSFSVTIVDSKTGTPVSGAKVMLDGKTAMTNGNGRATLQAKVGKRTLAISKQYYKDFSQGVFVGISTGRNSDNVRLAATGRQVPIKVVNKITDQPITNAEIKVLDTEARTDTDGKAIIVLPTGSPTQSASITASGYNNLSAKIQITNKVVTANTFSITPSGRIYFLSNLSGKIDVVSTNLDGTDRQTVLAGTGSEDLNDTVLLASRDWKYLALLSKRDGGQNAKLFLINTGNNNQLTTMDEGDASFTPVGWDNRTFIYEVDRNNVKDWQNNQSALKSYNADTGKIATLDQTSGTGNQLSYATQDFGYGQTYIINSTGTIVYIKEWYDDGAGLNGKQDQILSISPDGTDKQVLKSISLPGDSYDNYESIGSLVYNPNTVYYQVTNNSGSTYYIYTNNSLTQSNTISDDSYQQAQQNSSTYLLSPSGGDTFWAAQRDGKNTLFVGDQNAANGKQIASLSDYTTYGWYTDKYLLVEKGGSELFVMPTTAGGKALKISDYYKPPRSFYGYGGGYGGL